MNWHVNQKVVCVRSHSLGLVISGSTYTVSGVRTCTCGRINLNVGIETWAMWSQCTPGPDGYGCNNLRDTEGFSWFSCSLFRPLDTLSADIERIEREGSEGVHELELQEL